MYDNNTDPPRECTIMGSIPQIIACTRLPSPFTANFCFSVGRCRPVRAVVVRVFFNFMRDHAWSVAMSVDEALLSGSRVLVSFLTVI